MQRWVFSADAFQHLPPGACAGQDGLMDFCLHDPGHLPHMLERRLQCRLAFGLNVACHQIANADHHGAQFAKVAKGLMRALRQVDLILAVEQPLDKTLD